MLYKYHMICTWKHCSCVVVSAHLPAYYYHCRGDCTCNISMSVITVWVYSRSVLVCPWLYLFFHDYESTYCIILAHFKFALQYSKVNEQNTIVIHLKCHQELRCYICVQNVPSIWWNLCHNSAFTNNTCNINRNLFQRL